MDIIHLEEHERRVSRIPELPLIDAASLRDCPRIGVAETLLAKYRKHMRPRHWPDASVLLDRKVAA